MKKLIILVSVLFSTLSIASTIVTLEDGRQVQLNDNFTWSYVQLTRQDKESQEVANVAIPPTAIPVKNQKVGTTIELGITENTMQLSHSGADVLLGKASYKNGMLEIPTTITNQGSQSIISIDLRIEAYDQQGKTIFSEEQSIWTSIKRMADTYLRPQKIEQGKSIKLSLPEQTHYQISAVITHVATR